MTLFWSLPFLIQPGHLSKLDTSLKKWHGMTLGTQNAGIRYMVLLWCSLWYKSSCNHDTQWHIGLGKDPKTGFPSLPRQNNGQVAILAINSNRTAFGNSIRSFWLYKDLPRPLKIRERNAWSQKKCVEPVPRTLPCLMLFLSKSPRASI